MADNQKSKKIFKLNIVISILVSFVAWVFVVYNFSPMKSVTYTDIPITYVGETDLVQTGLGIGKTTTDTVDVTLKINRKDYNKISAEDIVANVDVSNAMEGSNGLSVMVTPPEGTILENISNNSVSIDVVAGANKDVDLTSVYSDQTDPDREPIPTEMSYSRVSVLGAADNVAKVTAAVVRIDANYLGDAPKSFVAVPVAVDKKGKEVPHVVVLPSEISFKATEGTVKTVQLNVNVRDNSEVGKTIDAPDTITIKGPATILKGIEAIDAEPINVSAIAEDTSIEIEPKLPEGVSLALKSMGISAKVVVK